MSEFKEIDYNREDLSTPEETPCKSCREIYPTDHLKQGYCCFCIEHIPEELLTGNQSNDPKHEGVKVPSERSRSPSNQSKEVPE